MIGRVKKCCFTLIEILVVLLILSFGAILTGVKVTGIYKEQQFLSESQQMLSHLAMAQDLMLIMDADVQFRLVKDPVSKHLVYWLEIEKPIEDPLARIMERKIELKAIQSFLFEKRHPQELTLHFSLGRMSQGTLTLLNEKEKREFKIELLDYPHPFAADLIVDRDDNKGAKSERLYPTEVYEELYVKKKKNNP